MLFRTMLAFSLLIFWPFTGHAPALSESHFPQPAQPAAVLSLLLDPSPLPPPANPAAEAEVFEQTLSRTIELLLPLDQASATAIHSAADAFSARKRILLQVTRFSSGSPVIEFIPDAAQPGTPAATPHRDWARAQRGADAGSPVFELFADVDALRHTFEDSFADGRAGRVIHALGVPNARSLALHGRWIAPDKVPLTDPALPLPPAARRLGEYAAMKGPPLIRLDLSWNSRSDEPSIIRGINIAAGHWPAVQLRMDPPAAPFLCLFRADFHTWLRGALAIRSAWIDPGESSAFEQVCVTWLRANRPTVDRIIGAVPTWLIVHPTTRRPEWLVAETPVRAENVKPDPIVREIDQLIRRQFADRIEVIPDGGSRFTAPADWPLRVIAWKPNPLPQLSTVQFRIDLRGGHSDTTK